MIAKTTGFLQRRRRMLIAPSVPDRASGRVASFISAAVQPLGVVADIEPAQNLNGFSAPWPGGGGKNKIRYPYYDADGTYGGIQFSTDGSGHITASGTPTAGIVFDLTDSTGITLPAGTYTISVFGDHTFTSGGMIRVRKSGSITNLATIDSGSANDSAAFTLAAETSVTVAIAMPFVTTAISIDCDIMLEAGGSPSAYEPYQNYCPVSGHTGLNLYLSGKNLSPVGSFVYPTDGTVCVIAENLLPGLTYTASAHRDSVTTTGSGIRIRFQYDINGETIYDPGGYGSTGWMAKPCAVPANATNVRVAIQRATAVSAYTISDIQLELGETRTEYKKYHAFDYIPISWQSDAGTVCGGTLDLSTGLLTADLQAYTCDVSGTITLYSSTNNNGTVFRINKVLGFKSHNAVDVWQSMTVVCSHFFKSTPRTVSTMELNSVIVNGNTLYFCMGLPRGGTSLQEFKDFLQDQYNAGTPVVVVADKAAALEYQLTRSQVAALIAENNIFTDVGKISVDFKRFAWQEAIE